MWLIMNAPFTFQMNNYKDPFGINMHEDNVIYMY